MIRDFLNQDGRLCAVDGTGGLSDALVWIDLINPTRAEEAVLEKALGINLPTKEEMEEIEISSRLYTENGSNFMTALLPGNVDSDAPDMYPVTFVLVGPRLVTVRYHEPTAFRTFPLRAAKVNMGVETGEGVLSALLEAIVDHLADILERAGRDIDKTSRLIFRRNSAKPTSSKEFQKTLEAIGRTGDLTSNIRDSLVTLERVTTFLAQGATLHGSAKDVRERIKTLSRDVRSLSDHAGFLSQKITFLLEATLGMISIEQNAIIKIFSIVAVVFLPPTLIASIYGMNFKHMPELDWMLGYPMAIGLMIFCAIFPFVIFKIRGWL